MIIEICLKIKKWGLHVSNIKLLLWIIINNDSKITLTIYSWYSSKTTKPKGKWLSKTRIFSSSIWIFTIWRNSSRYFSFVEPWKPELRGEKKMTLFNVDLIHRTCLFAFFLTKMMTNSSKITFRIVSRCFLFGESQPTTWCNLCLH